MIPSTGLIALLFFAQAAGAQPPAAPEAAPAVAPAAFDAQARVTEALAAVRSRAMTRDRVDWAALEREARASAETARDTTDMLPIYARMLNRLGDGHSFVSPTAEQTAAWRARYGTRRLLPDVPPRRRPTSTFMGRQIGGRDLALPGGRSTRLVVVPPVQGDDASHSAADRIYAATVGGARTCGYVVDLRGNTGGNMWPMLSGLSNLLPNGRRVELPGMGAEPGAFIRIDDGVAAGYGADGARQTELSRSTVWSARPALASAPVALLLDDGTASSGEAVAVVFQGRPAMRSFGQPTYGLSTANVNVDLSDGVTLYVTVAAMQDQAGRVYEHGLEPDQAVAAGEGSATDPDDAVVEAAKTWLLSQPGCR